MYAYILETGRGFFEGVCAPCNATAHFRDPPPPIRESTLANASHSKANGTDNCCLHRDALSAPLSTTSACGHNVGSLVPL